MMTIYVLAGIELIVGILLCLRGLNVYKIIQMILCGAILGMAGLKLEHLFGKDWLYIVAIILAGVGAFLGYRFYRVTFYISANIIAFIVSMSIYWKRAVEAAKGGAEGILNIKEIFATSFQGADSFDKISTSINNAITMSEQNIGTVFKQAADIMKTGIIVSLIIAVIAGLLALWFGDYVVMVVTAAFGAGLMLSCACSFLEIPNIAYLIILIVLAGIGLYSQLISNKKIFRRS